MKNEYVTHSIETKQRVIREKIFNRKEKYEIIDGHITNISITWLSVGLYTSNV